ncbi:MAG TPA: hypothetical protein VNO43_16560 [Candidatus Eisenbacteria bacterium]|nr:hypothetical protein [Candidatus Eisenbacteria bacterium]
MFYAWLHVIALIVYLGAISGLSFILLPSVAALETQEAKLRLLTRGLKLYSPMQVGALGIVLFTGAFQLTELKALYRDAFVEQIAYTLGIKLVFAFFLIMVSVYQSLGVGHRFVRRQESGEAASANELAALIRRLNNSSAVILVLALITLWLGLRLRA